MNAQDALGILDNAAGSIATNRETHTRIALAGKIVKASLDAGEKAAAELEAARKEIERLERQVTTLRAAIREIDPNHAEANLPDGRGR